MILHPDYGSGVMFEEDASDSESGREPFDGSKGDIPEESKLEPVPADKATIELEVRKQTLTATTGATPISSPQPAEFLSIQAAIRRPGMQKLRESIPQIPLKTSVTGTKQDKDAHLGVAREASFFAARTFHDDTTITLMTDRLHNFTRDYKKYYWRRSVRRRGSSCSQFGVNMSGQWRGHMV